MNKSLRSTEPSLENSPGSKDKFAKQPLHTSDFDHGHKYSEEVTHNLNNWQAFYSHLDPHSLHFGDTSEIDHVHTPSISLDIYGATAHGPPSPEHMSQSARRTNDTQLLNTGRAFSVETPSIPPMIPSEAPVPQQSSAPPQTPSHHYGPFLGRFSNSDHAKVYRRNKMRFGRMPWRDSDSDPTIAEAEKNRDFHVERIYNAMVCGDFARDNANSTALKRWVYGAHYQSDLVEAYAHKVFDCLLEQVKKGFRGWPQNDYVNDERKGDDDDKDIDCAGRLDNIITALQQEKSICENVMSSAWQIRMFVNAPKAYAKRKDQNRVGNSKRPNTKSSEAAECEPRRIKKPRNAAIMRSKPVQGGLKTPRPRLPETTTLERQHKRPLQSASNSSPDMNATSSMISMGSSPSSHVGPSSQHALITLLSPTLLPPALHTLPQHIFQHGISMPSVQQRRASPPPSQYGSIPESINSNMTPPTTMAQNFLGWPVEPHSNFAPSTSPPSGLTANAVPEEPQQDTHPYSPCDVADYFNIFDCPVERGVSLLDVDLFPLSGTNEGLQGDLFDEFWDLRQTDVLQASDATLQQEFH